MYIRIGGACSTGLRNRRPCSTGVVPASGRCGGGLLGNAKVERDGVGGFRRCIPDGEGTGGVHPCTCHGRVVTVYHIFQALCGVHPFQPFLCVCLLIEVGCEEPVCFQPPAITFVTSIYMHVHKLQTRNFHFRCVNSLLRPNLHWPPRLEPVGSMSRWVGL